MELSLLVDKSAIQALSEDEASWMHHFFSMVVAPVLMTETLGNLRKEWKDGRDAQEFLASLARKIHGWHAYHNVPSEEMITAELAGHFVELAGRPHVGGAQWITADNGKRGVFFDVAPEDKALIRWTEQRFAQHEHELATLWREGLKQLDSLDLRRSVIRNDRMKVSNVRDALAVVDRFIASCPPWKALSMIMEMFSLPEPSQQLVKQRWKATGRPPISVFVPYCTFVMRANSLYGICDAYGLLPERATNPVDLHYLHYLPFCRVFTSADKLHDLLAPALLRQNQRYLTAKDLKLSLASLIRYYDERKEENDGAGRANYARLLPLEIGSPVHDIYDDLMPSWRDEAKLPPPPPITPEVSARIMAKLKPMMDAIDRATSKGND